MLRGEQLLNLKHNTHGTSSNHPRTQTDDERTHFLVDDLVCAFVYLPASEWKSHISIFLSPKVRQRPSCCDRHRPGLAFQTNEAPNTPSPARREKCRFHGCAHATQRHPSSSHTHRILVSIPAAQSLQTVILGAAPSLLAMVMLVEDWMHLRRLWHVWR